MKHTILNTGFNTRNITGMLIKTFLFTGLTGLLITACSKKHTTPAPIDPTKNDSTHCTSCQLTAIKIQDSNYVQKISWNAKQDPERIFEYLKDQLLAYDSCVYVNGRLAKVQHYVMNPLQKNFIYESYTVFTWDGNGNLTGKTSFDAETNKQEETEAYQYDAKNRLTNIKENWLKNNNPLESVLTWSDQNNVTYAGISYGGTKAGYQQVSVFDGNNTPYTHPLLAFILEAGPSPESLSRNNVLNSKEVAYLTINNKADSIVKTNTYSYTYNDAKLPIRTVLTSTSKSSTSSTQPVTLTFTYEYRNKQ